MAKETFSRQTFVKALTAGVVFAASLGMLTVGEYSINGLPTIGEGNGSYTPGTYTASAPGISSDVTVTCTFNETTITSIDADVSGETPGLGADIGAELVGKVLESQTSEIDGIAGCTITSDAFKSAVADCIAQAGGTVAETAETDTEDAKEIAEDAIYTPGTYTGTAKGMESDVTVTATFDEYSIVDITCDVSGETPEIGGKIGDKMIEEAIKDQTVPAGWISGATVTSDAFKAALADCIIQAGGVVEAETEAPAAEAETEAPAEETVAEETETPSEAIYIPGTYTGTAEGMESDVVVTATFDEYSIIDITCDVSGETPEIGGKIGDTMIKEALNAQSAELGWVTGATISSNAFKGALSECIAQATGMAEVETETEPVTE